MSTFKVPYTVIKNLEAHPDPETTSLEIATVYDFRVVVKKNLYSIGQEVIYVPIDSVLPLELEQKIFPQGSKITLNKGRVKQIRIRKFNSQGMIINPSDIGLAAEIYYLEKDLAQELQITKYEPPQASYQQVSGGPKLRNKTYENKFFHKYGGLDNAKWYPELFKEDEQVSITEKVHGSSIKAGWVPRDPKNIFEKLLLKLKLIRSHQWCYGSNNVQLQTKVVWWKPWNKFTGYYGSDIYGAALKKYNVKDKLKFGEVVYGEVYGSGIQANYNYGCKQGEHKLVLFDVKIQKVDSSDYLKVDDFIKFCEERNLPRVPELYRGVFNKEQAKALTIGDSVLAPSQKVREGVVIKPLEETQCVIGRKVLKMISEIYLSKDQTDFH